MTVHSVATMAAQVPGTTWAAWNLDDVTQAGSIRALAEAVEKLEPAAAAVGLKLNRAKCKLWGPGLWPQEQADNLPAALAGMTWMPWTSGVRVMGTPVGRAPFVRGELNQVFDKLKDALEKQACLGDPPVLSHGPLLVHSNHHGVFFELAEHAQAHQQWHPIASRCNENGQVCTVEVWRLIISDGSVPGAGAVFYRFFLKVRGLF